MRPAAIGSCRRAPVLPRTTRSPDSCRVVLGVYHRPRSHELHRGLNKRPAVSLRPGSAAKRLVVSVSVVSFGLDTEMGRKEQMVTVPIFSAIISSNSFAARVSRNVDSRFAPQNH